MLFCQVVFCKNYVLNFSDFDAQVPNAEPV